MCLQFNEMLLLRALNPNQPGSAFCSSALLLILILISCSSSPILISNRWICIIEELGDVVEMLLNIFSSISILLTTVALESSSDVKVWQPWPFRCLSPLHRPPTTPYASNPIYFSMNKKNTTSPTKCIATFHEEQKLEHYQSTYLACHLVILMQSSLRIPNENHNHGNLNKFNISYDINWQSCDSYLYQNHDECILFVSSSISMISAPLTCCDALVL